MPKSKITQLNTSCLHHALRPSLKRVLHAELMSSSLLIISYFSLLHAHTTNSRRHGRTDPNYLKTSTLFHCKPKHLFVLTFHNLWKNMFSDSIKVITLSQFTQFLCVCVCVCVCHLRDLLVLCGMHSVYCKYFQVLVIRQGGLWVADASNSVT